MTGTVAIAEGRNFYCRPLNNLGVDDWAQSKRWIGNQPRTDEGGDDTFGDDRAGSGAGDLQLVDKDVYHWLVTRSESLRSLHAHRVWNQLVTSPLLILLVEHLLESTRQQ